jgi:hypothetical protein
VVTVDEQAFGSVLLGRSDFDEAVSRGDIRLVGSPDLVRAFPSWLGVTRFARYAVAQHRLEPARSAV